MDSEAIREHNELQRAYFGRRIKRTMLPVRSPYVLRHVERMVAGATLAPGDRIIDVGCGMGKFTLPLLHRGLDVTGLDLSPELLTHFRDLAPPGTRTVCCDVLAPPEALRGRFDRVIGFFVLHHFPTLATHFRAMATLLEPGGTLTFIEPNAWNPLYYLQIALTPGMRWEAERGLVAMRRRKLERAAEEAALVLERIDQYGFFPPFVFNRRWGRSADRALETLARFTRGLPFQLVRLRKER